MVEPSERKHPVTRTLQRWPTLDGYRAIAVGLVMIGHYFHYTAIGSLGVAIFFVLSGFLITWLLDSEFERHGTVNLRHFYLRRALRLFPALYSFLAIAYVIYPMLGHWLASQDWLASALYFNDYNSALQHRPSNALTHTWSLGTEEKFYLLWPLAFLIARRHSRRSAIAICLATIIVAIVWRAVLLVHLDARPHYVQFAFDTRLDYLAAGCLLGLHADSLSRLTWPTVAATIAAFSAALALGLLTLTLSAQKLYALSFPLEYGGIALLLSISIVNSEAPGIRWLDTPAVAWVGQISYGIYLYHKLGWLLAHTLSSTPWMRAALGALLSIAFATASFYALERQFLRWKTSRFTPSAPSA